MNQKVSQFYKLVSCSFVHDALIPYLALPSYKSQEGYIKRRSFKQGVHFAIKVLNWVGLLGPLPRSGTKLNFI